MQVDYIEPRSVFDAAFIGLRINRLGVFAFPDVPRAIAVYDRAKVIELVAGHRDVEPGQAAYSVECMENQFVNRLGAPYLVNVGSPEATEYLLNQETVDVSCSVVGSDNSTDDDTQPDTGLSQGEERTLSSVALTSQT